ncbi:MAG: phosphoribosyl-ATP pyrophosphohydrolase [Bacillota bacterium]
MRKVICNKLVRDKVPEILAQEGKEAITEVLPDEKYIEMLNAKLVEEVAAYLAKGTVKELADIGEVMHGILAYKGISLEEFQKARMEGLQERGGFSNKLFLKEIIEK